MRTDLLTHTIFQTNCASPLLHARHQLSSIADETTSVHCERKNVAFGEHVADSDEDPCSFDDIVQGSFGSMHRLTIAVKLCLEAQIRHCE